MEWNSDRLYKLYWTDTYCISKSRHHRSWHRIYFCPKSPSANFLTCFPKKGSSGGSALHQPSSPPTPPEATDQFQPDLTDGKILQGEVERGVRSSAVTSSVHQQQPAGTRGRDVGRPGAFFRASEETFPSSKIRLQLRILILHAMEVVMQKQEKGLSWSDFINLFKTSLWWKHFALFQWMLPLCIILWQPGRSEGQILWFPLN